MSLPVEDTESPERIRDISIGPEPVQLTRCPQVAVEWYIAAPRLALLGNLREHRLHYRQVYSEQRRDAVEILAFPPGNQLIGKGGLDYAPQVETVRSFDLGRGESPAFRGLKEGQPLGVGEFTVFEGSVEQVHIGSQGLLGCGSRASGRDSSKE